MVKKISILFTIILFLITGCNNSRNTGVPKGTDSASIYTPPYDSASNMLDSAKHKDTSMNHTY